jgi:hypothetical protein
LATPSRWGARSGLHGEGARCRDQLAAGLASKGCGTVKDNLLQVSRGAAGVLSAALVGRSGIPALAVLAFLTVLCIMVICWIVSSDARSMNLSRILCARRGDRSCLAPGPKAEGKPPPAPRLRQR